MKLMLLLLLLLFAPLIKGNAYWIGWINKVQASISFKKLTALRSLKTNGENSGEEIYSSLMGLHTAKVPLF